jgi:integrase
MSIEGQITLGYRVKRDHHTNAVIADFIADPMYRDLKSVDGRLVLRLRKSRAQGTWYYLHPNGDQSKWYALGDWPLYTATEAKKILKEKMSVLFIHGATEKSFKAASLKTVGDVMRWYLERLTYTDYSPHWQNTSRSSINRYIMPGLASAMVTDVSADSIDKHLIIPMRKKGLKSSSCKVHFTVLKQIFKAAFKAQKINVNPMARLYFTDFIPGTINSKPLDFDVEDVTAVLGSIQSSENEAETILFLMMVLHGNRIGELRQARWKEFKLTYWRLPHKHIKTGKKRPVDHTLPLTEIAQSLLAALKKYQASRGYTGRYLFPQQLMRRRGADKPLNANQANELMQTLSSKRWTSHVWRKTFSTVLQLLEVDYVVRKKTENHAVDRIEQTYNHAKIDEPKLRALEQFARWIMAADIGGLFTKYILSTPQSKKTVKASQIAA